MLSAHTTNKATKFVYLGNCAFSGLAPFAKHLRLTDVLNFSLAPRGWCISLALALRLYIEYTRLY